METLNDTPKHYIMSHKMVFNLDCWLCGEVFPKVENFKLTHNNGFMENGLTSTKLIPSDSVTIPEYFVVVKTWTCNSCGSLPISNRRTPAGFNALATSPHSSSNSLKEKKISSCTDHTKDIVCKQRPQQIKVYHQSEYLTAPASIVSPIWTFPPNPFQRPSPKPLFFKPRRTLVDSLTNASVSTLLDTMILVKTLALILAKRKKEKIILKTFWFLLNKTFNWMFC